jgi:hypothetical protein
MTVSGQDLTWLPACKHILSLSQRASTDHLQRIFLESLLSFCFLSRLKIHQREKNLTNHFYDSIRNRTGSLLCVWFLYTGSKCASSLRVCSSSESSLTLIWYCSWKVNIFMPKIKKSKNNAKTRPESRTHCVCMKSAGSKSADSKYVIPLLDLCPSI